MIPVQLASFKTAKGFNLHGLWYGHIKPKRVIVFVHGLAGSMFGGIQREMPKVLVDSKTAVFTFNNRGHDVISKLYKDTRDKKGYKRILAGGAQEVFTDCVDDIQSAIDFVRKTGVKSIFLAGHSTGCQKSIYWASRNNGGKRVRGIVLLAPVSDHAAALDSDTKRQLSRAISYARKLQSIGDKDQLLPLSLSPNINDAQRFLSLYTPESRENIFPYDMPDKKAGALTSVQVPVLVVWAGSDEYSKRTSGTITHWFEQNIRSFYRGTIILGANHSFKGKEKKVAQTIANFMKEL